jgi:hypothetical protein
VRFLCAAMVAAFLPLFAHTAELKEGKDWRYCSKDDQCVMIEGLCDKTAVNWQAEKQAVAFYKQQRPRVNCSQPFWRAGEKMPRCHLGGCEVITKQGADAKPKPSK